MEGGVARTHSTYIMKSWIVFHMDSTVEAPCLLTLPAEIRTLILEYVFASGPSLHGDGFKNHGCPGGISLHDSYTATSNLAPLLTCRQFYADANLYALSRTSFTASSLFCNVRSRLAVLHPTQIEALRSIAFVADARHFRDLLSWGPYAFGVPGLRLHTLTIVLYRSSYCHYLFDFTAVLVRFLRNLSGVQKLVVVRNNARVQGSFRTWYNRLVGLLLKVDHHERYECVPARPEKTWWKWEYDAEAQSFCLEALPAKEEGVEEALYMEMMRPLIDQLVESMSVEDRHITYLTGAS
ncbi:hypothetical protein B0A49_13292 [Cryomyces minteri]|uniref:Uncharacterized protein n=1 Tax=Cryomyces minteri TaxID=331657 RepID=A0A4U0UZB1_9PEZI|nr:hypothetical protein B0A49_13292 [Cryomyces minteri]